MAHTGRWSRRRLLGTTLGLSAASLAVLGPGRALADCLLTPVQGEGPFYPPRFGTPANDLLATGPDGQGPTGQPIAIVGRVTDAACRPLPGAVVEIWQADARGRYAHPRDTEPAARDPHFRYWGRAVTDADGGYRFRTLQPAPYKTGWSWRTPHVHFKVRPGAAAGGRVLTTQMYFRGHELNTRDGLLTALPQHEQAVLIASPQREAATGLTAWRFDIALA